MPLSIPRMRRRTAEPDLGPPGPADEALARLLDRDRIIDRFDADYLHDLPILLRELHGIDEANARGHERWPDLEELWRLSGRPMEEFTVAGLADAALAAGVDRRRFTPRQNTPEEQKRFKYTKVRNWREAVGVRLGDGAATTDAVETVNRLQSGYSHEVQGGKYEVPFDALERPETGDPWSELIKDLVARGVLRGDEPHLTIGPRWVGEIHYFREGLGLSETVGLDLFTHDDALVKVGDMHDMPFPDDQFGLIYQRNTFDKSYDIRRCLSECVRVLRDGGILISDDCYDYTHGVSEMARTNIKHNDQLVRALGDHAAEVLFDRETPSQEDWIARVGQVAVRIQK